MEHKEKCQMDITYEQYQYDESRILISDGMILYKIIDRADFSVDNTVGIIVFPEEVTQAGDGPYFDENHNQIYFGNQLHYRFGGLGYIPEYYRKTVSMGVVGVHDLSEIGNYIGQKNAPDTWLTEEEIERIFSVCRDKEEQSLSASIYDTARLLSEAGFENMNPDIKYTSLSKQQIKKRGRTYRVTHITGSVWWNDPHLICPVCKKKYVAHNAYDVDYPYVDRDMAKENMQPLTFKGEDSHYKYYCLACGSHFGIKHNCKEIFAFGRGAYFTGALDYRVIERNTHMWLIGCAMNDFCDMPNYEFCFPKEDMQKLLLRVKAARDWNPSYETDDDTYDGYGWEIKCLYKDINIHTAGYDAFPDNYESVVRKIQIEIEKLCKKYALNYTAEGVLERIFL